MENIPLPAVRVKRTTTVIPAAVILPQTTTIVSPRWKRLLDISLVVLASPAFVPLSISIALVIKCLSRGPVLFRQERIGFLGQPFICLKFRTMRADALSLAHQH